MNRYKNLGGHSGIAYYQIGSDSIKVKFLDGDSYLYTYASAGTENIEYMKQLAKSGRGLNTFISKNVRERYEEKSD